MTELRRRFGQLVAAHRRRRGLTQEGLAERAGVSAETVAKIETARSGARFTVIEKLAKALEVDPAELFTTQIPAGAIRTGAFAAISLRLASLAEPELVWMRGIVEAILSAKRTEPTQPASAPKVVATGGGRIRVEPKSS